MKADLILTGGRVRSGHLGWRPEEAVAVAGDRVVALGTAAEVMQTQGPSTRVVKLGGRTVLPGLIDAHVHLLWYAISLGHLALAPVRSLGAMRDLVAAQAARQSPGTWIFGRGYDQDRWPERREPTRFDLDPITPEHPVLLLRNCNHVGVANSAALRAAGISRSTPDPAGGRIDRDPATGEPTGMLREAAVGLVRRLLADPGIAQKQSLLRVAVREALACGITQVHTDDIRHTGGFEAGEEIFRAVVGPEALPFRVTQMIPMERLEEAEERAIRTGAGDGWYRYGQVKIFADGSLGGRTAALQAPYADDPTTSGIYIHDAQAYTEQVCRAHALGNQVGSHCIGDGAAALFIQAVNQAQRRQWRADHRHRMIHCQVLDPVLMQQMRGNQIMADIQPVFLRSDGHWYSDRVGPERARHSYAWKSLHDLGIALCGGSDCPIEPLNIWYGVHAAVTRRDLEDYPPGGWDPEQALSVADTLNLYTSGAAYATFEEEVKGHLRPGAWADLVVLDRDPFECDPMELKDVKVHATYVGGRLAHEA